MSVVKEKAMKANVVRWVKSVKGYGILFVDDTGRFYVVGDRKVYPSGKGWAGRWEDVREEEISEYERQNLLKRMTKYIEKSNKVA
jgi:hypothetical protein